MNKKELKKEIEYLVKDFGEDIEERFNDFYEEIGIEENEEKCIEVNNLLIKLLIEELKGYKIIGD